MRWKGHIVLNEMLCKTLSIRVVRYLGSDSGVSSEHNRRICAASLIRLPPKAIIFACKLVCDIYVELHSFHGVLCIWLSMYETRKNMGLL